MINKNFIDESIHYSLLRELSLSPKPGLVSKTDSGCHTDMDYNLMHISIDTIASNFYPFIKIGETYTLFDCLEMARPLAIDLENKMLISTHNVNTHKGAIYLFALTCISLGYAISHQQDWNSFLMNFTILNEKDYSSLISIETPKTYGQKIYKQYGLTGVIGEVHNCFPSITSYSLPALLKEEADTYILLKLIAHSKDTCILHHNSLSIYKKVQNTADALSQNSTINQSAYLNFCNYCNTHHISCGGSADLLALTFYFEILQKNFF